MADGSLKFDTKIDTSGFTKGLSTMSGIATKTFDLTTKAVAAVSGALSTGTALGVTYNSQMEQYTTSFEVMLGSAEDGAKMMEDIKKKAASTPFEIKDLASTTQLLLNYGFTQDEVMDKMSMLGDISQGNSDKLNSIATAYGQMSSAGKVSLEDVKQMIEAGFNPLQEISESTGESMESLYDRISKGTISVDEITASMERSTSEGGKYFQSMEKQSQTLSGKLSTLKDDAMNFLGEVTQGVSNSLAENVIPLGSEYINTLSTAFNENGVNGMIDALGGVLGDVVSRAAEFAPTLVELAISLLSSFGQSLLDNSDTIIQAAQDIATALLDGIGDAIPVIEPLTDILSSLVDHFDELLPIIEAVVVAFVAYKAAIAIQGLISGISAAITGMSAAYATAAVSEEGLTVAQWALNAAMDANIIGIIIIAIAGLVAAIVALWNNCEWFRDFWIGVWDAIVAAVEPVWQTITGFFEDAWIAIQEAWANVQPFFEELWQGIQDVFSTVVEVLGGIFSAAWTVIQEVWSVVAPFFQAIWDAIQLVFSTVVMVLGGIFQAAWTVISEVWSVVGPFFQALWDVISSIFSVVADVLGGFFSAAWSVIQAVWDVVGPYFEALWEGIKAVFSVVADVLGGFFSAAWSIIQSVWSVVTSFFGTIWDVIKGIFSAVTSVLSGDFSGAWDAIKGIWDSVVGFFGDVWNGICGVFGAVGSFFGDIFKGAWDAICNAFSGIGDFFGGIWDSIVSKFTDIGTSIADAVGGAFKGIVNGVLSTAENIVNGFFGLINGAIGVINEIPGVNIGKIELVSFPRLAKGGVLKKGQVGFLEGDGDEAVIPLSQNKEWIGNVAKEMMQSMGSGGSTSNNQTINIYQPVKSPSETARAIKVSQKYGLAGM